MRPEIVEAPKVFYEIGTLKLAFKQQNLALKCQNLAFKMPAFGIYEIDPWSKIYSLSCFTFHTRLFEL